MKYRPSNLFHLWRQIPANFCVLVLVFFFSFPQWLYSCIIFIFLYYWCFQRDAWTVSRLLILALWWYNVNKLVFCCCEIHDTDWNSLLAPAGHVVLSGPAYLVCEWVAHGLRFVSVCPVNTGMVLSVCLMENPHVNPPFGYGDSNWTFSMIAVPYCWVPGLLCVAWLAIRLEL